MWFISTTAHGVKRQVPFRTARGMLEVLCEAGLASSTVAAQRRSTGSIRARRPTSPTGVTRQHRFWNDKIDALEQHLLDYDEEQRR